MHHENLEYFGKVLNGYIIHERSLSGYARLLLSAKASILIAPLALFLIVDAFPGSSGLKLALGGFVTLAVIPAIIGIGWLEARHGKPVFRFTTIEGAKRLRWQFENPQGRKNILHTNEARL